VIEPYAQVCRGGGVLLATVLAAAVDMVGSLFAREIAGSDGLFTTDLSVRAPVRPAPKRIVARGELLRAGRSAIASETLLEADGAPFACGQTSFRRVPRPDRRETPEDLARGRVMPEVIDRLPLDRPLAAEAGIVVADASRGRVELPLREALLTPGGVMQGALVALVVEEAALALAGQADARPYVVTELDLRYLAGGARGADRVVRGLGWPDRESAMVRVALRDAGNGDRLHDGGARPRGARTGATRTRAERVGWSRLSSAANGPRRPCRDRHGRHARHRSRHRALPRARRRQADESRVARPLVSRRFAKELGASGVSHVVMQADHGDRDSSFAVVARAADEFGGIDALVANAQSYSPVTGLENVTEKDFDRVLDTGVKGSLWLMQAVLPHMEGARTRSHRHLRLGDGLHGGAGYGAYAASKEGVRSLTRTAANEWGRFGITVNCVCPASVAHRIPPAEDDAERRAAYAKMYENHPLGRDGDPETDIAPPSRSCSRTPASTSRARP